MDAPRKTNMTMERNTMNEDVSPIKSGDFPLPCSFFFLVFFGLEEAVK